ncbi:hypothetical protein QR680_008358 [Steinernema hermaphroditum]|uniref:Uncharacterized protein n=1 Tax=Steinernema hermaphroditum TaxID=289476 RepID=A0AA39IIH2_9BILA|nr:hypothetical protein QR680_008358 [Steinernema hermaphroditum]
MPLTTVSSREAPNWSSSSLISWNGCYFLNRYAVPFMFVTVAMWRKVTALRQLWSPRSIGARIIPNHPSFYGHTVTSSDG